MSTKLSSAEARTAVLIQQVRMAPGIPTEWLPISYVMAHVAVESGFDPGIKAADYSVTGSEGLLQVSRPALLDVMAAFPRAMPQWTPQAGAWDTAAPLTSLTAGMLDLHLCRVRLAATLGPSLPYRCICMAYNEGAAAVLSGRPDSAYWFKWVAAQTGYAALDKSQFLS